jgi:uncharacterized protein YbjT (DUF2867 family)
LKEAEDMNTQGKLILVCGVTGRQGNAVARHLLETGFRVRGLTRDPNKPTARSLDERGAEIVAGNLDERGSIAQAVRGVDGVFAVQNFWETGFDREVRQGKLIADAAQAAGVKHFVYSSVGSAHRQTGLVHFESKWKIEEHLRAVGIPRTILRPVFFMQNWQTYAREDILSGVLQQPLDPKCRLQQIAVDDIGAFAAMAFANPDKWIGRELDLAGDAPTMTETADTFSRVLGRPVRYQQVPWARFAEAAGAEMAAMYRWFSDVGYNADIAALRREYPRLATLEQVLRTQDWRIAKAA